MLSDISWYRFRLLLILFPERLPVSLSNGLLQGPHYPGFRHRSLLVFVKIFLYLQFVCSFR